jgi:Xaa-Pro aminopeptidase
LFVESAADAARARVEIPYADIVQCEDLTETVCSELDRLGNRTVASAPAMLMPFGITRSGAAKEIEDGTSLINGLLLVKSPVEIEAVRRAAVIADEGYKIFMEAFPRSGLPGEFHDSRLGRGRGAGYAPARGAAYPGR